MLNLKKIPREVVKFIPAILPMLVDYIGDFNNSDEIRDTSFDVLLWIFEYVVLCSRLLIFSVFSASHLLPYLEAFLMNCFFSSLDSFVALGLIGYLKKHADKISENLKPPKPTVSPKKRSSMTLPRDNIRRHRAASQDGIKDKPPDTVYKTSKSKSNETINNTPGTTNKDGTDSSSGKKVRYCQISLTLNLEPITRKPSL